MKCIIHISYYYVSNACASRYLWKMQQDFFFFLDAQHWSVEDGEGGGRFKYGISIFINVISARKKKRERKNHKIYIL